ncbi:MAG: 1-acyl-sn-glycerol-3-phosphate acyltransferase [Nitrospirae bacterium]|nr:1-acyl-sn-glycerol-3-phosphate acyltransferase [Nitrospirota bacterium]
MTTLKKIFRLILLTTASTILILPAILINLILAFSYTARSCCLASLSTFWAKCCCRALAINAKADGQFKKETHGFIVSNHISYTDIFVIASMLPCAFLSKEDVRRWPIIGLLSILAGTVFIDRSSKSGIPSAIKGLNRKLNAGLNVVVFPEGTTSDSTDVLPFKSSFFELPLIMDCPIVPVSIRYSAPLPEDAKNIVAWHGNEPFLRHFWRLLGCKTISVNVYFSPQLSHSDKHNGQTRKELAMLAHETVRARYKNISA